MRALYFGRLCRGWFEESNVFLIRPAALPELKLGISS